MGKSSVITTNKTQEGTFLRKPCPAWRKHTEMRSEITKFFTLEGSTVTAPNKTWEF